MKKIIILFSLIVSLMLSGSASATLYDYYSLQGLKLPSIEARKPLAEGCSISNYTGSKTQNLALEACLRSNEFFGGTPTPTSSAARKYVEAPDFFLYSPAVAGDTSITLNDLEDIYGNTLTMADFGSLGYGRIDPDGATVSESFSFTGVTANSDGTFTLTGIKTALAKYPYTQTSGLVRSHSINAIVRFTNTASFYDDFANKENDEIIDGAWSFTNDVMNLGGGTPVPAGWRWNSSTNQMEFRRANDTYRVMPTQLRGTYADYASLPTSTNSAGDIAITEDDDKMYVWDATGLTWVLAGGSSGAGTVYKTNKLGSESDGGDLQTFSLSAGSWPSSNFLLVYKNGQSQREGATYDYTIIDSDTIQFTTTLASDDTVQMFVVSVDLYNPAWGSVNASIIPDTDNAYDLGNATHTFKDAYVTGTLYLGSGSVSTSPNAGGSPKAYSNSKIDDGWITAGGLNVQSYTAGETINTTASPLAVYLNPTDGRVYKTSSAAATTTFTFIGFAQQGQNISAGSAINIQQNGLVYSFSGMTTGSIYYISTAGTVSSTAGTVQYKIGKAISPTTLLIEKARKSYAINASWNSSANPYIATTTIDLGFSPTKISFVGGFFVDQDSPFAFGQIASTYWHTGTTYGAYYNGTDNLLSSTYLWGYISGGTYSRIKISSVSGTSVTYVRESTRSVRESGMQGYLTFEE